MDATATLWLVSLAVLVVVVSLDLLLAVRRPHAVSMREAGLWTAFYVTLALVFGGWLWAAYGTAVAGQFYAGYLTEYSLSVDNLFVFVIIMARFRVPRENQQFVLLVGIIMALVMRAGFIVLGASAIVRFSWVFYLFGAFLIYTSIRLATHSE
ncbi:MAG: TerC family protein, partial [Actinomycetes bacterium]